MSDAVPTSRPSWYSLIEPPRLLATNKFPPDTARPVGELSPVISEALTTAPAVVYSPIVPPSEFTTNRFPPEIAMLVGLLSPVMQRR